MEGQGSWGWVLTLADLGGGEAAAGADLLLLVEGHTAATTAARVGLVVALTKAARTLGLDSHRISSRQSADTIISTVLACHIHGISNTT